MASTVADDRMSPDDELDASPIELEARLAEIRGQRRHGSTALHPATAEEVEHTSLSDFLISSSRPTSAS
jgi:hypothetical protein